MLLINKWNINEIENESDLSARIGIVFKKAKIDLAIAKFFC